MRRAPSLLALEAAFPQIDRASLVKVRECIHLGAGMVAIDRLLENHGVESVLDRNGALIARYSNSGDMYAPTILLDWRQMTYRLTTLGDYIEAYERRHARLP
jgi:hypothetical protein